MVIATKACSHGPEFGQRGDAFPYPCQAIFQRGLQAPLSQMAPQGLRAQFAAIILDDPTIGDVETSAGGVWSFLRVQFKLWPGQGSLIETTFRQQVVSAMKGFDPNYADWRVPVTYRAMPASKTARPHLKPSPD